MKKVCFLIGNLNLTGGTERVTSLIANELVKQNYDISILSLFMGMQPAFEIDNDVKLYSLFPEQVSMKRNFFSAIWKIRNFVQSQKIETLIVVDSISCIFTVPALLGLKINHICWEHFNYYNNNGSRLRDIGRKLAVAYCSTIIVLTKSDKNIWNSNLPNIKANLISIPNPSPYTQTNHNPSLESKIILSVGRLSHVKGFDLLLQAWSLIYKQYPNWKLKIVGSGEEETKLKSLCQELSLIGQVIFIPRTNNIEEHYKAASFYCLSSRNEGFPMVLLEAQAYGLPIVAFDCETGPSEILKNGINGYLCEKENINLFSKKMKQIIDLNQVDFLNFCENSKNINMDFLISKIIKDWEKII